MEGADTVESGNDISATGNTHVSFDMDNETAQSKIYTIRILNVKDACGASETNAVNNSNTATFYGVPDTSEIISN